MYLLPACRRFPFCGRSDAIDGLWLAALLLNVNDGITLPCGLLLMLPGTPITEIIGARGFTPLTQRTVVRGRQRNPADHNATVVVGLAEALAVAGIGNASTGQVLAVPDAEALLAIELPRQVRCLVIINPAGDASFGDGPTIWRGGRRLQQTGRRVRMARRKEYG